MAPGTLRRLWGFVRHDRIRLTVFIALIAVDAGISAGMPLVYRAVIDQGIAAGNTRMVVGLAGVLAGAAVITALGSAAERLISARIGEGLVFDLRRKVFDHVQAMPLAFFARTQTGALVQRLGGDVVGAQRAVTSTLSTVVSNTLTVVFVIVAMVSMSWQITALALVLLPVFVLPVRWVGRKIAAITAESMTLSANLAQTMTERFNVAGAGLVKNYSSPAIESARFSATAARVRDIGVTQAMYGSAFRIAMTLVASIAVAIVYGLGGVLAVRGTLTVGVVVALTSYLTRLYGPITALSNVQVDIMTALVSVERIWEVLDLQPSVRDTPGARELVFASGDREPGISLRGVWFRYPAAAEVSLASLESVSRLSATRPGWTLRDVSFEVPVGVMVALVGPSGAGKTTASLLVSRMYDPTVGTVRVCGQDVRSVTGASLHRAVGVVAQDAHLFHDTIRANLALGRPDATDADLWEALDRAQATGFVERMPDGLATVVGDRGYRMSGGERQRIAIARLLLKAPPIVVLDEATAHLDSESEAAVHRALDEALRGRTSLVIAHRLSTVRAAHAIGVLDAGRIAEQGSHSELLAANGLYAALYRTQFETEHEAMDEEAGPRAP
ncbi:MAG: ABC transporter ATP-binding protein/permease [Bifidobacteriaceae bacterium]|nr:ABC transporter ATP-binding protein/permease [Bifidobacteriaceae bacterium]